MLAEIARSLAVVTRRSEVLARWGGDEFGVLLPESGAAEVAGAAPRLQAAAYPVGISLSAGWAAAEAEEGPEALFARADADLYRSKRYGPSLVTEVREVAASYVPV